MDRYIQSMNKRRVPVKGDGHCLAHAVFRGAKELNLLPQFIHYLQLLRAINESIKKDLREPADDNTTSYRHFITEGVEDAIAALDTYEIRKDYNLNSNIIDAIVVEASKQIGCGVKVHYEYAGSFETHAINPMNVNKFIELSFVAAHYDPIVKQTLSQMNVKEEGGEDFQEENQNVYDNNEEVMCESLRCEENKGSNLSESTDENVYDDSEEVMCESLGCEENQSSNLSESTDENEDNDSSVRSSPPQNVHTNDKYFDLNSTFSKRKSDGKIYINDKCWSDEDVIEADQIPYDIDGNVIYQVPYDEENRFRSTRDGREWGHRDKSRRGDFHGDRYLAKCKGCFQCLNPCCPHIQQFNRCNTVNFSSNGRCRSCTKFAVNEYGVVARQPCPARKIWEFLPDKVIIKHYGTHICTAKTDTSTEDVEQQFELRPATKPCELRHDVLGDMIRKGSPLVDVEQTANQYLDRKKLARAKKRVVGDEYSELAKLKRKTGKDDKFLLYRYNTRESNNEPTYIFKTGATFLDIIRNLDRKGNHFMNNCPVYFDATEKHVRNMTTYTLSTYHPMLRKLTILATMDCESESFENCLIFFNTLKSALSETFLVDGMFDPSCIVMDEKTCNWLALASVFGEDFVQDRAISCEFHYKQSVNKRCDSGIFLSESTKKKFKTLCWQVLEAQTVPMFQVAAKALETFIASNQTYSDKLSDWFDWWQDHKQHIFRAFKSPTAPEMNLAETVHAQWYNTRNNYLSVYDAAVSHIVEHVTIKQMICQYGDGGFIGGTGPSFSTLGKRAAAKQAQVISNLLDGDQLEDDDQYLPTPAKKAATVAATAPVSATDTTPVSASITTPVSTTATMLATGTTRLTATNTLRTGYVRSRRSATFEIALKNGIDANFTITDEKNENKMKAVFQVRSGTNVYEVVISYDVSCTCLFFANNDTPCKHLVWIMINKFNQKPDCSMLQQMHLTAEELKGLFTDSCAHCRDCTSSLSVMGNSVHSPPKKTLRARLLQTSTKKTTGYPDGAMIPAGRPLSLRPCQPEPQNDPYWLVKREGNIRTCHGCLKKTLGIDILGRIESDYSVRVYRDDGTKQWKLSTKANYYHPTIDCLLKRRPNMTLKIEDIRVDQGTHLTTSIKSDLGL